MTDFVKSIAFGFFDTALEMSPYLLFGFFMAGLLSILISPQLVERHLGGRGIWPVVKASLFGVPLPLCSCGVIPVTTSLYKHGASRASAISFLLSTPQTGIDSILVTYSLLGWVFAVFRPIAAFITGVFGGAMVNLFDKAQPQTPDNKNSCTDECCRPASRINKIWNGLRYGFITLPRDIAWPLVVGIIIAAFISALVPDDFFAEKLPSGILAILVMMALGIPVYVCATASVPIAAAMMMKGLGPGAAFVFLVTGPATNAASIVTIWKILGRKTAVIYLLSVVACALAGGLLLDFLSVGLGPMAMMNHHGRMLPLVVNYISAAALFFVLAFAILHYREKQVLTK
ncbi:MAG: SO_0444 family Cu/Zn efflux transporter [Sedimentisphaerales bacterium]|nr:SO_0444 family Cu/Zn efflux transporter [Sedimentisphaerales bacterium]